jgi:hypothetical protein
MFGWQKGKKSSADGPDYFRLQSVIERLLQSHGLTTATYKEWILASTELPAFRASLAQTGRPETTRLVVELRVGAGQTIIESFAGVGQDAASAARDALENFCNGALHVFLAAFWNHIEPDQVLLEHWPINGATWSAHIGNYVCRATKGEDVPVPADAFPVIEALIRELPLTGDLHWVRTFYCHITDEQRIAEALLDNAVWRELQDALLHLPWPPTATYYSARNFLILKKVPVGS